MFGTVKPLDHAFSGDGRRFALLLIHPLGADLRFWDECVALWAPRLSCLAVTLRASIESAAPVPLEQHAMDLEALRLGLGVERVVPVGCAIGAMVAAAYGAAYPAATAALVLANAAPASSPQAGAMLRERARLVREGGLAAILPAALERAFLNQPRDARFDGFAARFAAQSAADYAFACLAAAGYDAESHLRAIQAPTLLVPGEHDMLLPPALSDAIAVLIPGAQLRVLPGAAHFGPYQRPERFAQMVLEFLNSAGVASTP